jgi:hypothetical protein
MYGSQVDEHIKAQLPKQNKEELADERKKWSTFCGDLRTRETRQDQMSSL